MVGTSKGCSAAPREGHLLPWCETAPHLAHLPVFSKPFHCRHTELFSSWQHLGPRHACNCVIPRAGIRISVCASPCPWTAFSFLRGTFLLLNQHVTAASPVQRAFVPVLCVPEFLYARVAVVLLGAALCGTAGWSDNRGIRTVGDPALMKVL